MISTVIDKSLGLEFPIFQGGMAWVADASLAAGVSNAGGLGLIAAMNSNGEQLRAEIKKCKELTDKPFGVNIMLMSPFVEGSNSRLDTGSAVQECVQTNGHCQTNKLRIKDRTGGNAVASQSAVVEAAAGGFNFIA